MSNPSRDMQLAAVVIAPYPAPLSLTSMARHNVIGRKLHKHDALHATVELLGPL